MYTIGNSNSADPITTFNVQTKYFKYKNSREVWDIGL